MKKKSLIERRAALKKAYYEELKKINVIDTPEVEEEPVKEVKKVTKKVGAKNGK